MPPLPVQQRLHFTLSHKTEKAIIDRELDDAIQRVQQVVDSAFPDGLPVMDRPGTPEERFARYQAVTIQEDLPLLAMDGYIEKFKKGEAAPFLSTFWRALVLFPAEFAAMRRDYMNVSGQMYEGE